MLATRINILQIGSVGVGKTVLFAMLSKYLYQSSRYLVEDKGPLIGNQSYFHHLISTLDKVSFPARTSLNELYEVSLKLLSEEGIDYYLNFFDLSGEDLATCFYIDDFKRINALTGERGGNMYFSHPKFVMDAFEKSNVLILTTSINDIKDDDCRFYEILKKVQIDFPSKFKKISITVAKWDEIGSNIDFKEYIKTNLPQTMSIVRVHHMDNVKFAKVSVGKVVVDTSYNCVIQLNFSGIEKIFDWLIDDNQNPNNDFTDQFFIEESRRENLLDLLSDNNLNRVFEILNNEDEIISLNKRTYLDLKKRYRMNLISEAEFSLGVNRVASNLSGFIKEKF